MYKSWALRGIPVPRHVSCRLFVEVIVELSPWAYRVCFLALGSSVQPLQQTFLLDVNRAPYVKCHNFVYMLAKNGRNALAGGNQERRYVY